MPNRLTVTSRAVEDDGWVREDVAAWFRQQGVDRAGYRYRSGRAAVDPGGRPSSSSLSDINLADAITGWDVAEAGRVSHQDLEFIYASGWPKGQARLLPQSVFLSKPVSP